MRIGSAGLVAVGLLVAGVFIVFVRMGDETDVSPSVVVDERVGVLHGVELGDRAAEVRDRRGAPTDDSPGFFPKGSDYTGPPGIPSPQSDQSPPRAPRELHLGKTAYLISPSQGVYSMATLEAGARTRAGVGVGDELALVRERYDQVDCGNAVAGESVFGGETPTYPWCRAVLGEIHVFFGGDPIESITLTRLVPVGAPERS